MFSNKYLPVEYNEHQSNENSGHSLNSHMHLGPGGNCFNFSEKINE